MTTKIKNIKPKKIYTVTPDNFINCWKLKKDVRHLISKVNWEHVSMYKDLPIDFLQEFKSNIVWLYAYKYQKIPHYLLETTGYEIIKWDVILKYQNLSEDFIEKHIDKLDMVLILRYQQYSENFLLKYFHKINWNIVSYIMKIKNKQLLQYVNKENNWLYLNEDLKLRSIALNYKIVTIENVKYIECFKAVRHDYSSIYAPHLKFDKLDYEYQTNCDYNYNNQNSFGFGCWTFNECKNFAKYKKIHNYKILKILAPFDNCCWTGSLKTATLFENVFSNSCHKSTGKLRTSKFKILEFCK